MRSKNTDLMRDMIDFINTYYKRYNNTPPIRKISEKFNLAKSSVQRYLVSMSDSGMIEYGNGKIVTEYIRKFSNGKNFAPRVGEIPCGNPNEEEELIEEYVNLPESIFGSGDYYILTAKGDSMVDEDIEPGDCLVIESSQGAHINDIIVALDEEGRNTLKKYGGFNNQTNMFELRYCNEERYPGKIIEVSSLAVQGILRFVIKKK